MRGQHIDDIAFAVRASGVARDVRVIGDCLLVLGDCKEVLPHLGKDLAVVSDPPYGMKWDGRVSRGVNGTGKQGKTRHYNTTIANDDVPFDPSWMLAHEHCIIWGMNHFPQHLTRGSCLVWVKRYESGFGSFLSDAEVAYFSKGHGVYCFRDLSNQAESNDRSHPTQKPIPLMRWCIEQLPQTVDTILDPYMGSGTTGVACVKIGRRFIGCEIEPKYFEIACKRVEAAYNQPDMFVSAPAPKPVQLNLMDAAE
jgi:hypothetical protein